MKRKTLLYLLIIFGVFGLLLSLYMVKTYYNPAAGSVCDFSEKVSCSFVNTSTYAVFLGVPVAVLGLLWNLVLSWVAWKTLKKGKAFITLLFYWALAGFLFILYMLYAEWQLKTVCPFCTVLHVLGLCILITAYALYKKEGKPSIVHLSKIKPLLAAIIILFLLPILFLGQKSGEEHTALAQCITESGAKFYGAFWCGHCNDQKEAFGEAIKYINYIECSTPDRKAMTKPCIDAGIEGFPTWIFGDNSRASGTIPLKELARRTGCTV